MPLWLTAFLTMFAGPIGNLITKGLALGSTALVTWSIAHGVPADAASNIAGDLVAVVTTGIGLLASTMGVKINAVNVAPNGVKVVPASSPTAAVNVPLH